jgi:ribose transport system ATP-binding protein
MNHETILTVKDITKSFGVVTALKKVDFSLRSGEIHGLIGENGSGKSTLSSIISGMQKADIGEMHYKGEQWEPSSVLDALRKGIGMIVQESGTIPGISVAENIYLGEIGKFSRWGFVKRKTLNYAARRALEAIEASDIDECAVTGSLDFQSRKLIEIAKVMLGNPKIVIVDETTTALSQKGREILYRLINKCKEEDGAVIFISHDLDEIMSVCDRLTVLRDGQIIRNFDKEEFDEDAIRAAMIGRVMEGDYYRSDWDGSFSDEVALEAKNLFVDDRVRDVSLQLHKGEILGIGGLSHCGMHTLGKTLFAAVPISGGEVLVHDKRVRNERFAVKNAIGYVSKDRDVESLSLNASIRDNIAIAGLPKITKGGVVTYGAEKKYVQTQIDALAVKCVNQTQEVAHLSGGNKQKVVFGKWVGCGSNILILDCPTRGVDIGVKQAMYRLITQLKKEGKSILMISEEMTELMGMCDRILIMKDGQVTKEFERSAELSEMEIIRYMI